MKILNVEQIHAGDQYTIQQEPIASIDLMERAVTGFVDTLMVVPPDLTQTFKVFCGVGNNGGDGLGIARCLCAAGYPVEVFVVVFSRKYAQNFLTNEQRLKTQKKAIIHYIKGYEDFPEIAASDWVIDALFGAGLNRPIGGFTEFLVEIINQSGAHIMAVDVPSGLFADQASQGVVIQADKTISFQAPKLAFLFPENELYVGDWQIVDIGLHPDYLASVESNYHYLTNEMVEAYLQPKSKFHHKGKNGHALVIGGSYGKMGAAILTAKATLKAGAGLVTAYVPECGYQIMQIALPEAMCLTDTDENFISFIPNDLEKYATIAIGPGLGQAPQTEEMLGELIPEFTRPMVVDADALNIIAKNDWARHLPKNSILTPHPKEFERLVGKSSNSFERLQRLRVMALQNGIFIVLKGAHTCIACPDGTCYFNSTGSPAMATAGSGDVLTGMIAAFLSQGYSPKQAALLGVFYHGQAGDKAAEAEGNILAGDLIRYFRI